jgi:hypothetical protein
VFNFYDNFAGTTLSSKWTVGGGQTYTINNGLTLTESGLNGYAQTLSSFGSDVLEFYGKMYLNGGTTATYCYAGVGYVPADAAGIYTGIISAGCPSSSQVFVTNTGSSPITTVTSQSVWGIAYGGSSAATSYLYNNYLQLASRSDTDTNYPAPFGFSIQANSGWAFFAQWARVRAYPPSGVMPSATFGIIQGGSPSVTVSPSSVSVPSGTSFTLTANVGGGTSPYTYQWYNATSGTGIPIASATSSTYTATAGSAAGTFDYYVTVTDSESPPQTAQSPNSVVTVTYAFTSSSTYTVPNNVHSIEVTAVAGGGGGGDYGCWIGGGGGGAGESTAYLTSNVIPVTPGEVLNIVVGTGGIGGTGSGGYEPGTAGTATSISSGSNTLLSLSPGQGGGSGCETRLGGSGWPSGQNAGLYGGGVSGTYGGYGGISTLISGYGSGGAGGYVPDNPGTPNGVNGENGIVILNDQ